MASYHNTEDIGPVSIAEWEEHAHVNGDEAQPAGKNVHRLGYSNVFSGLISLASSGFPQQIPASPLYNRKNLTIFNSSATTVYWGGSSLASGAGIPIEAKAVISLDNARGVHCMPLVSGQTIVYAEQN